MQNKIWTPGFDTVFMNKFGYDIIPFMEEGLDSFRTFVTITCSYWMNM